jgi:hypothetical protein
MALLQEEGDRFHGLKHGLACGEPRQLIEFESILPARSRRGDQALGCHGGYLSRGSFSQPVLKMLQQRAREIPFGRLATTEFLGVDRERQTPPQRSPRLT